MRVLVVGTSTAGAERAETLLADAGHDVVRCHEPGENTFPCAGLIEGRTCPLDGAPVDVAVTARDHPWPRPTALEDGAVCALRQHVPLVVLGTALQPFQGWETMGVDDDSQLVAACEEAAALPMAKHSEVATATMRETVRLAGFDPTTTSAIVRRQRGGLQVVMHVPAAVQSLQAKLAAHVITELRRLDPHAIGIDVSLAKE